MKQRNAVHGVTLLLLMAAGCGAPTAKPAAEPTAEPSASTTTNQAELRAEQWGNEPCDANARGPHLTFATGPTGGGPGEQLLGSATLTPEQHLPATIALGDRQLDVRAFFRRCHEGRLQFLGVGITHDGSDKAIGFSPPLAVHADLPRKANACVIDLARFRADSCPGHAQCATYGGLTELHACSNQMYIQMSARPEPPSAEEKSRGVTSVVYWDHVGVASYKTDPISGDFTEMTLVRRIVRSELNPSMHD